MATRCWYFIDPEEREQGPFSAEELIERREVKLSTLVRKKRGRHWHPLKEWEELRKLFEERRRRRGFEPLPHLEAEGESSLEGDALTLDLSEPPPLLWLWLLLLFLLYLFLFFANQ